MDKKGDIPKEKTAQGKSRTRKQNASARTPVDRGDEVQQELRKWFEENRSLDPLALYAKFYSRF